MRALDERAVAVRPVQERLRSQTPLISPFRCRPSGCPGSKTQDQHLPDFRWCQCFGIRQCVGRVAGRDTGPAARCGTNSVSDRPIELKVVVDEANRLVRNCSTSIASLISVVRGSGIGLTLGNQDADLARTILSNSPNKFSGSLFERCELSGNGLSDGTHLRASPLSPAQSSTGDVLCRFGAGGTQTAIFVPCSAGED